MRHCAVLLLGLALSAPAAVLSLALSAPAAAEGFLDLYLGGAFTEDEEVTGNGTSFDFEYEDSAVFGIRGGAWGEGRLPFLGGAIDISGFAPDGDDRANGADLVAVPISVLLMARLPLVTSDEFPQGQLHPYVGVGPSLVISAIDLDSSSQAAANFATGIGGIEDIEADLGVDVRAGLDVLLTRHFGFFTEYRFTHFSPTYKDGGRRLSLDLDTHFVQGGVTFRFGG